MAREQQGPRLLAAAIVAVLAVLPFLPTLTASYLADDWFFVAAYRTAGESFGSLVWRALSSLGATPTTFYRPLPFMSLAAQLRLGHDAVALHAANLALHATAAALVFAIGRRLTGRLLVAVVAALLFAWFPRRTEAVAWLSCRPDVLAAAFALASLAAFQAFATTRRIAWWLASFAAWWLAVLSKESALLVCLSCVALVDHRFGSAATGGRHLRPPGAPPSPTWLLPFVLAVPAFVLLRRIVVGAWVGGYGADTIVPGVATVVSAAKHLAYQVVPPVEVIEPMVRTGAGSAVTGVGSAVTGVAVAAVAVALVGAVWWGRREQATQVGAIWIAATIVPVMVLPVSLTTTFNDRLLYLPGAGVALVLAGVLSQVNSRAAVAALIAVAAACGWSSWSLSERWSLAGRISDRLLSIVARALDEEPASRVYLTAVPDSVGGAYLLRNGVREALSVRGARAPGRVAVLAWYFVSPDDPARRAVRATRVADRVVDLESTTTAPQIIVGTPDARDLVEYEAPASTDRLGRRATARIRAHEAGAFWLVTPGGVESVETVVPNGR